MDRVKSEELRAQVLEGLKCLADGCVAECQGKNACAQTVAKDALELLKEHKSGYWTTKRTNDHDGEWYCDQCGYEPTFFENTPYCPRCGAKLELGR